MGPFCVNACKYSKKRVNTGMNTNWAKPKLITQYAELGGEAVHIPWDFNSIASFGIFPIKLAGTLRHIARSPKPNVVDKTYYVKFTQFQFTHVPDIITGIDIRLDVSRHGRITDDSVQLIDSAGITGDNLATLTIDNTKIYSHTGDSMPAIDDNFGIELRFKSHPNWPHNETVIINSVEIRLY